MACRSRRTASSGFVSLPRMRARRARRSGGGGGSSSGEGLSAGCMGTGRVRRRPACANPACPATVTQGAEGARLAVPAERSGWWGPRGGRRPATGQGRVPEGPAPQDRPALGADEGPAVERSSRAVPRLSDRRVLDLFAELARDIGDDHRPIRLTVRSIAATSFGGDLPWTTLTGVPALVYERDLDVMDEATMTLGGGGPAIAYHRGGRERPSRSPSQDEFRIVPPAAGGDEAQHPNGPAAPDVLGKITSGLLALGRPRTPYANGDA